MFDIKLGDEGQILLSGRLDASQVDSVRTVLGAVTESCTLDFSELEYISSLGLGVLLEAQKRLTEAGHGLIITNLSVHITDLFKLAGFDLIFEIR
ncbi:MAG: STAS domain-containing protein [Candidatus Eisenbacteria sp.]|nr:STAS domain-containing protein [Candidatus Eisenbacteria bacterium]